MSMQGLSHGARPPEASQVRTTLDEQLAAYALKQAATGVAVTELCREMGVNESMFDHGKQKFSGLSS